MKAAASSILRPVHTYEGDVPNKAAYVGQHGTIRISHVCPVLLLKARSTSRQNRKAGIDG